MTLSVHVRTGFAPQIPARPIKMQIFFSCWKIKIECVSLQFYFSLSPCCAWFYRVFQFWLYNVILTQCTMTIPYSMTGLWLKMQRDAFKGARSIVRQLYSQTCLANPKVTNMLSKMQLAACIMRFMMHIPYPWAPSAGTLNSTWEDSRGCKHMTWKFQVK